ncbi:MAG: hypothetical protein ACREPP_05440 [Rhodanobacteraceae bacterium]
MPAHPEREIPEHHVWESEPQRADEVPFDRYGHALLREIRGREPPPERWRWGLALFLAILFHIVLVVLVRLEMRPRYIAPPESTREDAITVNLYETPAVPAQAPAPPPPIELPPLRTREVSRRQTNVEQRNPGAITATIGETQSSPHLYNEQGQALLPPPSSAGTPGYATPEPNEPSLMKHSTPVPYQSTRFNKDWAPDKESLGAKAFRRAVDATTTEKTIRLPGGMKIKCLASPLMLAFGCGPQPPPPPSKNDNDARLSLPPSVSLTGKKVAAPAAPSTTAQPAKTSTQSQPKSVNQR